MNNIEKNALRIAELLDYDKWRLDNIKEVLICRYSTYDYLMEIVESEISDYELKSVHFELEGCGLLETVQKYVVKYLEQKNANTENPIINFQFSYRETPDDDPESFNSGAGTLKEAVNNFLTEIRNIYDIDEDVEVTYKDGTDEFVYINVHQDYDLSWYIVIDNEAMCGNGYSFEYKTKH